MSVRVGREGRGGFGSRALGNALARWVPAAVAVWLGVTAIASAEPVLEGRVTENGKGVQGAEVYLFAPDFHLSQEPAAKVRARTGPDGRFAVFGPPGDYLVVARAEGRFAYFGRNPVRLESRLTNLNLPLVPTHPATRLQTAAGGEVLAGRVLKAGEPVTGALVFVYVDASRGLRGPGYAHSEPTREDGTFQVLLPPGTYFVAVRHRRGGWKTGALEPGDLFGVLDPFPLVVRPEEAVRVDIETVALPSREQMARYHGSFGQLSGTIVDENGTPQAGLRACLYENPQMLDRPVAISEPTGPDGVFLIENVLPGSYFLGARELLGGPPSPGEKVGFLRGAQGAGVDVPPGADLEGLTVVTQEVP